MAVVGVILIMAGALALFHPDHTVPNGQFHFTLSRNMR
jgi:hypothetical protein